MTTMTTIPDPIPAATTTINLAKHRADHGRSAVLFAALIDSVRVFEEIPTGSAPGLTDGRWDQGEALMLRRILPGLLRDWARTYGGLSIDEIYPHPREEVKP